MHWPQFILFASEATLVGLWAAGFLAVALVALVGEWLRLRRKDINRVGWVPWTTLFMLSATLGAGLLLVAIKGWLAG